MIQNTAGQSVYFEARSLKDGTLVSGLSVSASLSLDGAAPVSSTNTVSEIGTTGRYQLLLSQSETDHYTLAVLLTTATADVFLPLIQADFTPVPVIPTVSQIQSGLAKTSELPDVSGLATLQNLTDSQTAIVSACATASGFATPADVPTVAQIWAGEVARNTNNKIVSAQSVLSSLYTADPATFAKEASLSAIPTAQSVAQYVWSASSRTLTGAALNGSDSLVTMQTITPLTNSMMETQNTVTSVYSSVLKIPTATYNVPTVAQIQDGLATSQSVQDVQNSLGLIPTVTYNVPTVSEIQAGLAKTSELPDVPTVSEIQAGLAKTSELPDVSTLATASSVAAVKAAVDEIPTVTYTVPTVAEIQDGLAKSAELPDVSTLATSQSVQDVQHSLELQGSTLFGVFNIVSDSSSMLVDLQQSVQDVQNSVGWIPTVTYNVPTVAEIQEGLAASAEITALQTYGDTHWKTSEGVSTPAEIASAVWLNGARTLTASPTDVSGLATAQSVQEVKAIASSIPTATYNVPTVSEIQEGLAKTSELPDVSGLATAQAAAEIQAAVGLIPTVTYTVPTAAEIASAVIAKDFSGETFPLHSLAGGVCAHLHFAVGEESITVYGPDGETVLGRIPYTSAASAEPITGLGVSNE